MTAFLHAGRLRAWCRILAGMMALWAVLTIAQASLGRGTLGQELAADFTCYRAAGTLALHGAPAAVYQSARLSPEEHAERGMAAGGYFPFLYPPTYLLLCLPLAVLPYWPSLIGFLLAGLVPMAVALRRLVPASIGWLPILAFPGLLVTAGTGQNGFFSAACFAGFMLMADERPLLAGACLGALACKPHLALLAPLALLAAGRWRCMAGAALAFGALVVASLLAFGTAPWLGFAQAARHAGSIITGGMADPTKIQSAFIAVRLLGGSVTLSAVVQAAVALGAVATLVWFVRGRPGGRAEGAALAAGAMLATPYLADYDLACLAPPLAYVAARGAVGAFETPLLMLAYLLPLLSRGIAARTDLQIAPLVIAALLAIIVWPAVARKTWGTRAWPPKPQVASAKRSGAGRDHTTGGLGGQALVPQPCLP